MAVADTATKAEEAQTVKHEDVSGNRQVNMASDVLETSAIVSAFKEMEAKHADCSYSHKLQAALEFASVPSKKYIDKTMLTDALTRTVNRENLHRELVVFCMFLFVLLGFRYVLKEIDDSYYEAGFNVRKALVDEPWAMDADGPRAFEQIGEVKDINDWLERVVAEKLFANGPITFDTGGFIGAKAMRRISPVVLRVLRARAGSCSEPHGRFPRYVGGLV